MKKTGKIIAIALASVVVFGTLMAVLLGGSSQTGQNDQPVQPTPMPTQEPLAPPTPMPTIPKEEVLAMRETVLTGMSEEDVISLTALIRSASHRIEGQKLHEDFFQTLSNPDSLLWQTFEQSGNLACGLEYQGSDAEKERLMQEENLTEEAFLEKYGTTQIVYNPYSAEDFAQMLLARRATVQNEALRQDLQNVVDKARLAAQNHDVNDVIAMYHILHDLDYFLLNYRLDTEGTLIVDKSTVGQYFGTLAVYGDA